jgi:ADP-ribose pyrophosphatase YjhB (NUDIX family)
MMQTDFTGVVTKICYCALSITVAPSKVLYLQKFPPAGGAFAPDFHQPSSLQELTPDSISKSDLIHFWKSKDSYQPVTRHWKGGAWGTNNLPTLDEAWLTGIFIGDNIDVTLVQEGIIPFHGGKPFSHREIVPGTETAAWSVHIQYKGKTYSGYLTDNIMPQRANDVLFIWENKSNNVFIKLLTRGSSQNIDMPQRMMPGAGEHLEPGKDVRVKAGVLRAIQEEIGIEESVLSEAYLLPLGRFDTPGRDPRYWSYSWIKEDGSPMEFGIQRGSSSEGYVVYIKSDTDVAPKEVDPLDTEEVHAKWWAPLNFVLQNYPDDRWMILDHKRLIPATEAAIITFKSKTFAEKEACKLCIA